MVSPPLYRCRPRHLRIESLAAWRTHPPHLHAPTRQPLPHHLPYRRNTFTTTPKPNSPLYPTRSSTLAHPLVGTPLINKLNIHVYRDFAHQQILAA